MGLTSLRQRPWAGAILGLLALLSGCGGGGGGSGSSSSASSGGASGGGTTTTPATCSLLDRQNWALAQLQEWYLFPDTLPSNPNPSAYTTVEDYIDSLTATARAQGHDRYFTYLTSISGEDAYYNSGSSAGFGFRIATDAAARTAVVTELFEGAPALAAGIDRGTQIIAIGTSTSDLRQVSDIIASSGTAGVTDALGPSTAGTTRLLRVSDSAGTRNVSVTKSDYSLTPVSSRYGAKIISDGGIKVGYVNLRTFISTADPALRSAFLQFQAAGVTQVIVDLRYNGGGLISIAETFARLLGGNRATTDVIEKLTYRPEKSSNNTTAYFAAQPESISAMKIAFIGTGGTASASELVANAFVPFLHANAGLIGTNTYGKPVGQIAIDRSACDDRFRIIAFAVQNAAGSANYYTGLASVFEASCQAADDVNHPMGDPAEASTRAALDFIEGKACTKIATDQQTTLSASAGHRLLLTPTRPDTAQREVPGLF
ncbi:S41 family peptidase [Sphingomonas sp. MMS24-J13]|uniref:S41 family peptidase n=1 Tax=Sphingomonas sp. MMS24-J13 TaxID=3238686 RepID=UPI00384E6BD1